MLAFAKPRALAKARCPNVPILKFCAFHPNALVPQGAAKRPRRTLQYAPGPGAAFWRTRDFASLLRMRGWVSPRQSTLTVNRTNFESGTLVCIDGRRALAPQLATEHEQMVVHQTANHIEPQQNAVRPMTDRPHEAAKVEVS
jgi:hypothetical protein